MASSRIMAYLGLNVVSSVSCSYGRHHIMIHRFPCQAAKYRYFMCRNKATQADAVYTRLWHRARGLTTIYCELSSPGSCSSI
ncbi:hypothetical protein BC629DRAFT_1482589 [Irpex lacteus]|nr:hypothetical protein BC629DRAFT_1482589 [Irpex lacteus]